MSIGFAETADLVIINARVYTVDPTRGSAASIAIRGNLIVAASADVSSYIGPNTKQIDAKGRTIVPGLIDSHVHMAALGASLTSLDLRGVGSEQEAANKTAEAARKQKPGDWVSGRAWDQNLWPAKQFPTLASLDAAAPNNPVFLSRVDGHAAWVNSRALALADVNAATKDPEGGRIVRDSAGRPSGVLLDRAQELVTHHIPQPDKVQLENEIEAAAQKCVRDGLTSVDDAGVGAPELEAYRALIAENRLPLRVYAMILLPDNVALWEQYRKNGPEVSEWLTVRSLKLYADGALGSRGAALLGPYSDDPGNSGLQILTKDFIEKTAREAIAAGFQVNTHAIGDRANHDVLDAYEAALGGKNDKRFRIEHAQVVAPRDFQRFRDYSIIASMQPTHATSDMPWAAARLGGKRILGAYAWQNFLKIGVHVASGSDTPVEDPNPLWGFYSAVTREDHEGRPYGGWFPAQRMTRAQALRSWTIEGAYADFQETRKGSIEVGKLADLVMFSDNIMEMTPEQIWKVRVVMTIVDGKIVYREP